MAGVPHIRRWPAHYKRVLAELIQKGYTIQEIAAHFKRVGAPRISQASIGRHVKRVRDELDAARKTALVTKAEQDSGVEPSPALMLQLHSIDARLDALQNAVGLLAKTMKALVRKL